MSRHEQTGPTPRHDRRRVRLIRALAGVSGALLLGVGVVGVVASVGAGTSGTPASGAGVELDAHLVTNGLRIILGLAGVVAATRRLGTARKFGWVLAIVSGSMFAYGVLDQGRDPDPGVLAGVGENALHLMGAVLGLMIALLPARSGLPQGSALADEESAGRYMAG